MEGVEGFEAGLGAGQIAVRFPAIVNQSAGKPILPINAVLCMDSSSALAHVAHDLGVEHLR